MFPPVPVQFHNSFRTVSEGVDQFQSSFKTVSDQFHNVSTSFRTASEQFRTIFGTVSEGVIQFQNHIPPHTPFAQWRLGAKVMFFGQ